LATQLRLSRNFGYKKLGADCLCTEASPQGSLSLMYDLFGPCYENRQLRVNENQQSIATETSFTKFAGAKDYRRRLPESALALVRCAGNSF
jgi:hypothetical protein